jgi:hypothetical protein
MGVLYLLTLGLFGIGWIIDIFMIATNHYKDNLGRPLSSMGSKTSKLVNFFLLGILFGGIFTRVTGSTDAGLILGFFLAGMVISGRTLWNWILSKIQNKVS